MKIKALVAAATGMVAAVLLVHSASAQEFPQADIACTAYGAENAIVSELGNGQPVVYCHFEDARMCTLDALATGDCEAPGRRTTGFYTEAARYCARSGGDVAFSDDPYLEEIEGTCTLPNGMSCLIGQLYYGQCG